MKTLTRIFLRKFFIILQQTFLSFSSFSFLFSFSYSQEIVFVVFCWNILYQEGKKKKVFFLAHICQLFLIDLFVSLRSRIILCLFLYSVFYYRFILLFFFFTLFLIFQHSAIPNFVKLIYSLEKWKVSLVLLLETFRNKNNFLLLGFLHRSVQAVMTPSLECRSIVAYRFPSLYLSDALINRNILLSNWKTRGKNCNLRRDTFFDALKKKKKNPQFGNSVYFQLFSLYFRTTFLRLDKEVKAKPKKKKYQNL